MRRQLIPHVLFGVWFAATAIALVGPVAEWAGARIEPYVLGLPFSLAWSACWALGMFVALALYYRATDGGRA